MVSLFDGAMLCDSLKGNQKEGVFRLTVPCFATKGGGVLFDGSVLFVGLRWKGHQQEGESCSTAPCLPLVQSGDQQERVAFVVWPSSFLSF